MTHTRNIRFFELKIMNLKVEVQIFILDLLWEIGII